MLVYIGTSRVSMTHITTQEFIWVYLQIINIKSPTLFLGGSAIPYYIVALEGNGNENGCDMKHWEGWLDEESLFEVRLQCFACPHIHWGYYKKHS